MLADISCKRVHEHAEKLEQLYSQFPPPSIAISTSNRSALHQQLLINTLHMLINCRKDRDVKLKLLLVKGTQKRKVLSFAESTTHLKSSMLPGRLTMVAPLLATMYIIHCKYCASCSLITHVLYLHYQH